MKKQKTKIKHKKFGTKFSVGDTVYCIKDVKPYKNCDPEEIGYETLHKIVCKRGKKCKITKIEHHSIGYNGYTVYNTWYIVDGEPYISKETFTVYEPGSGASGMSSNGKFEEHFSKDKPPMSWDEYFLNLAEQVKLKSKDESTKIGAVIVGEDNEVLSVGYNSFPRGCDDNRPERQERPEKYFWFEHAERNAIYNAARVGTPLKGARIYLSSQIACMDCARAIINSGIKKIYCKREHTTQNKKKWEESCGRSVTLFQECGVEVIYYDF